MIQAKNPIPLNRNSSPEKVLFVITKSNFGGAQRYVLDLATHFSAEYECVVACGKANKNSEAGALVQALKKAGVRTILIPELTRDIGFADFTAFRALRAIIKSERPDVLHLNSSKAGALGAFAGRFAKVPRILFTAHGWPFWENRSAVVRVGMFLISWLTVLFSHRTICVSGFDRAVMAQAPFTRKKLVVIRNGIEHIPLKGRDTAREELFSPEERTVHEHDSWVITTAELTSNKNLFAGIDAVALYNSKHVRKMFWSLMGEGEERESLETYAKAQGVMGHMKFLGFVPGGQTYYSAFDAFFLPSKKEGLPYVLLEAGLARLSVATTRAGGIPELIGNGIEGAIAPPDDTEALAEVLQSALEHPEWGQALFEKVTHEYSMEQMIRETSALY